MGNAPLSPIPEVTPKAAQDIDQQLALSLPKGRKAWGSLAQDAADFASEVASLEPESHPSIARP